MHLHRGHGLLVLGYVHGRNGVSLILVSCFLGGLQTIADLFSRMTILQQRRAVLVFRGDSEPMVRVGHFAAPIGSKLYIGVMGVFSVLGDIG